MLVFVLSLALPFGLAAHAHDGEDHSHSEPAASGPSLLPRDSFSGEAYEVVAEIANGNLIIFVDDTHTNAPVTDAAVELIGESGSVFATQVGAGLYQINSFATKPGSYNLMLSIDGAAGSDLVSMKIVVPQAEEPAGSGSPLFWIIIGQSTLVLIGLSSALLLFGLVQSRRGRWSPVLALPGGFTLIGSGGRHLIARDCVQRVGPQMLIAAVLRKSGLENIVVKALIAHGGSDRHFATILGFNMRMLFDPESHMPIARWAQDTKLPIAPPQQQEVSDALAWLDDKGGDNRRAIEAAFIAAQPAPTGMAFFYLLETGGKGSSAAWLIYGAAADGRPIGVESLGSCSPDINTLISQIQMLSERGGYASACVVLEQFTDPSDVNVIAAAGIRFVVASHYEGHINPAHTGASVLLQDGDAELRVEYSEVMIAAVRTIVCRPASGANLPISGASADWLRFGTDFGALQTNLDNPSDEIVLIFNAFTEMQRAPQIKSIQADQTTGYVAQQDLLALFTSSAVRYQVQASYNRRIDWVSLAHDLNRLVEVKLKDSGTQSAIVTEVDGEAGLILAALTETSENPAAQRGKLSSPHVPALSVSPVT
ncbi:MAG: hypothetical protein EBY21_13490 [Alphaproteobacteria bacterium]|nr:hypothetical protein [Alphaproteobacteria bacterium]